MNFNLIRNVCRIGAVAGLFGAVYFSAKRGSEICRTCKQVNDESFGMTAGWKLKHYIRNTPRLAKPLAPTLVCAAGSITCMAISEKISYKQIAALTATCVYLTKNRDFLEKKLEEVVGKERLAEIKQEFVKKESVPKDMIDFPCIEITGKGDLLCLEGYSGRWFRSTKEAVEEAQEMVKVMHEEGQYISMNDYYGLLGISMTQFGNEFGWPSNKDYCEDILSFTNTYLEASEWNDVGPDAREKVYEPIYVLEIDTMPMYSWMEV